MRIVKCDICRKTLTSNSERFSVTRTGNIMTYASFEFCSVCSKPLMKILKNKRLIKDNHKKHGGKK